MAITNGYITLEELKASISLEGIDVSHDSEMEQAITAVSRNIDDLTGRFFYADGTTGTPVVRYYTANHAYRLFIDDFTEISTIKLDQTGDRTYGTTLSTTDYCVEPINNPRQSKPYTQILLTNYQAFPFTPQGVKVTGVFGWSSVPDVVRQACLIQSSRIFLRRSSPFGIAGSTDMGTVRLSARLDPDVTVMLNGVMRQNSLVK